MKTIDKTKTRFPKLTEAVLENLDLDQLEDVARHGADAGWSGFVYYSDTTAFFRRHKDDILRLASDMAHDMGEDMLAMVAGFRCLHGDYFPSEIAEAIYGGETEGSDVIQNAMVWFALEEVARELHGE